MSAFTYIFVHGLSGWGSYDKAYRRMPYWGMRSGDLIAYLRENGFDAYVASVAPTGSAWDRACDLFEDPDFDPAAVKTPWWSGGLAKMMSMGTSPKQDGRDPEDYAGPDMHLDRAKAMNERIPTLPDVYYFSVPCSFTERNPDGTWRPGKGMAPLFVMWSCQIGAYAGRTAGGMMVDETWRENDGLVNTVSASAPSGAPYQPLDKDRVEPGIWNVFPKVEGDHMWPQGGLLRRHDVRLFYLELLTMISQLKTP